MLIWILFGVIALLGWLVSSQLQSKFKRYSKIPLDTGMTGRDVATKMLHENGIYDVQVIATSGMLTDNYNPIQKTVNLSEEVFASNSISAAAVAAHECGHAIQHAKGYKPLTLRSKLVPIVCFSSKYMSWIILAGILLVEVFSPLLWFGIGLFALTTLFSLITLPVEIDASRRAIQWLDSASIINQNNKPYAVDALKWAAYTYVVAAISSITTLIYYILIATNSNRR